MNEELERNQRTLSWPIQVLLQHFSVVIEENYEYLTQDSCFPKRDSKQELPKYKKETTAPQHSIRCSV
jgi:hypothetical protein